MTTLTTAQRVTKAHVWLTKADKYKYFSGVLMHGKAEIIGIGTAATDGDNTWYCDAFCQTLPDKELRGLVLHENFHKGMRDLMVWQHLFAENAKLANIACDYVNNLTIYDSDPQENDVALPKCGLLDQRFRGMDAGAVYKLLKGEHKRKGTVTIRTAGDPVGKEMRPEDVSGMDEHMYEAAKNMSEEAKDKLNKEIDYALRSGKARADKSNVSMPQSLAQTLVSPVNWREAMSDFICSLASGHDYGSWRKPSRRWVAQDIYMPSVVSDAVGRGVIAIDLSGSIDTRQLNMAVAHLSDLCSMVVPEGVDLLYWDTAVRRHEKYEPGEYDTIVQSTKPAGGGGTSPSCITRYFADTKMRPEWCVVITDGIVGNDWGGQWPCPVLWAITTDVVSPVGKTVALPKE